MSVHLYTVCWDEADMLGFFFRHYDSWVDRYVVYDDGSNDGSLDVLHAHPKVEVRRFERVVPDSFVLSHTAMQDNAWKESRGKADWVVITAIDEHLVAPGQGDMRAWLAAQKASGVTLIPAIGFNMISESFPTPCSGKLADLVTHGRADAKFNKLSLFDPQAVRETGYTPGRHRAAPEGRLRYPDRDELVLLHFKRLGFERVSGRQIEQSKRRPLSRSVSELRAEWDAEHAAAVDLADPGPARDLVAETTSPWWRRNPVKPGRLKDPAAAEADPEAILALKRAARVLYDEINGPGAWKGAGKRDRDRTLARVKLVVRSLERQGWSLSKADGDPAGEP
jgi:hypothetical protein